MSRAYLVVTIYFLCGFTMTFNILITSRFNNIGLLSFLSSNKNSIDFGLYYKGTTSKGKANIKGKLVKHDSNSQKNLYDWLPNNEETVSVFEDFEPKKRDGSSAFKFPPEFNKFVENLQNSQNRARFIRFIRAKFTEQDLQNPQSKNHRTRLTKIHQSKTHRTRITTTTENHVVFSQRV